MRAVRENREVVDCFLSGNEEKCAGICVRVCEGVSGNEEKCAGICVRVCEGVSGNE